MADTDRLREAFSLLTADERQLLTCALAGNYPGFLSPLRLPVVRALARADLHAGTIAPADAIPTERGNNARY